MSGILSHGLTLQFAMIAGVILTGLIVVMLRQRRSPGSSMAWLMAIVLLPPIGIPAFLIFGGRKLKKIIATKPGIEQGAGTPPATDGWSSTGARLAGSFGLPSPTGGNQIRLHANGEEAFADLIKLIEGAKRSIAIQTYVFKHDATGKAIMAALTAQAKKGVAVRLLLDGFGAFPMSRLALWRLKRAGGKTAFFMPVWRISLLARSNLRNHRKIAVFDGEKVFAGGRNLAFEYLGAQADAKRWHDLSFVIEGQAVADYAHIFNCDWGFATNEQPEPPAPPQPGAPGGGVVQVVPAGPDVAGDALYAATLSALFQAQKRIWIVTPYFVPNEPLAQALTIAARRGVDVRILVPASGGQILTDLARGPFLRDAVKAGAKALAFPAMVHAKAVLIDDAVAMVGSANFDTRSMFLNFEVMSMLYSPADIRAVEAWIGTLFAAAEDAGKPVSAFRDTVESAAYLVAPLL